MIIYEDILRAFQKQKVKYVLVGGIAVNLLGFLRNTADLDILVAMSDENLRKVVGILKKKGYHVKQPVDPMGIADRKTRYDWIHHKNMKAFNFYKEDEMKEVDIIIDSPVSFEKAKRDISRIRIDDMILPVISLPHLIKMKQDTGRKVDQWDVEELKWIKKIKKAK